jgi:hypothetical protein
MVTFPGDLLAVETIAQASYYSMLLLNSGEASAYVVVG